jgi:hypothetical protein
MKKFISMILMLVVLVGIVSGVSLKKRQKYVDSHPYLSIEIRQCILGKKIMGGMTCEEVAISWGRPDEINRTVTGGQTNEQWVYVTVRNQFKYKAIYVYFENGIVTAWQD